MAADPILLARRDHYTKDPVLFRYRDWDAALIGNSSLKGQWEDGNCEADPSSDDMLFGKTASDNPTALQGLK